VKASPHQPSDKRQSTLRRNFNDLFMRDGQMEESKFWANVGKALCAWLIITQTDSVMHTEYTLFTLLLFIVFPDLIKKFMTMRFGVSDKNP
jgi:hypothetical protein